MNGIKKIYLIIIAMILLLMCIFFAYTSIYYHAEDSAKNYLSSSNVTQTNYGIVINSEQPTQTGIIFYPGAKVETSAYLPLWTGVSEETNTNCILVDMPFRMAIFDKNAALDIMKQFPDIETWYIAGHSMGGAMASAFAETYTNDIEGLIVLGAYIYGEYPDENTLTVYGSLNTSVAEHIDYTENIVVIEGGNHAQFGNYGQQKGDAVATISAQEQQSQTITAIKNFIS